MTSQLYQNSFSTSTAAVNSLAQRLHKPAMDREILWPKLLGMSPKTRNETRRIDPRNTASFGNPCIWDVYKRADFINDLVLELTLSPIVTPGSTFNAYRNGIGSGIIQGLRIYQSGATLQELGSNNEDYQVFRDVYFSDYPNYAIKTEENGYLPFATRVARSGANQVFEVRLNTIFDYFAIPVSILSDVVQVEIVFKSMIRCLETDGAIANTTASILSAVLRCDYAYVSPNTMSEMLTVSKTTGLEFPYLDFASQNFTIAAGTTVIRELCGQFRGLSPFVFGWLRANQDVSNVTGDPTREWTNTIAFNSWNLQIDGQDTVSQPDDMPARFVKHLLVDHAHRYFDPANYNTSFPIFFPFSLEPFQDLDHLSGPIVTGYFDMDLASRNTYVIINLPAALVETCQLTMFAAFYNTVIISNGSIRKYLV